MLVLKGVPLAKEYYQDFGARPMADADLMVPEAVTIEQIRTLLEGHQGGSSRRARHSVSDVS